MYTMPCGGADLAKLRSQAVSGWGPMPAGPGRRWGKEGGAVGGEKGKKRGAAGAMRACGRKAQGGGLGPPENAPNFPPRQSQEAGAGIPAWDHGEPDLGGARRVTTPRGHQAYRPWPCPPPWLQGKGAEERGGLGAASGRGLHRPG